MIKLLHRPGHRARRSTAAEASNFDTVKWLGQWIERLSLPWAGANRRIIWTRPRGGDRCRLLGAMRSGSLSVKLWRIAAETRSYPADSLSGGGGCVARALERTETGRGLQRTNHCDRRSGDGRTHR